MQPQRPQNVPQNGGPIPSGDPYGNRADNGNNQAYRPKEAPFIPPSDANPSYNHTPANNYGAANYRPPVNNQQQPSANYPLPANPNGSYQPNINAVKAANNPVNTTQPIMPIAGPVGPIADSIEHDMPHRSTIDEIKNLFYTIGLFILAPLFAIFMIVFVFQSYIVDGSSMEPTLQNGNRVFILKLPKSIASLQGKAYVPDRTDVIVFKKPTNDGSQLIKRVIGLPGERVVIKEGYITVYNNNYPEGFNPDSGTSYSGTLEPVDTGGEVIDEIVEDGRLFVLGDNRGPGGSLDSHSGLGQVPIENIVGKLWLRYFPLSEFQFF
jgi:signal peptidase I